MGSDLYDVRVLSKEDRTASLDVRVVHPDAMDIPADPSFALMMIREGADDDDPIAREVAFEDTLDETWMTKFAKGFIHSVTVHEVQRTRASMRATMQVTVTSPAWVAHLTTGKTWASRAFELVRTYDDPENHPAAPLRIDDAFVWVPRECFVDHGAPATTPALLEAIAYAPSAYAVADEMRDPAVDHERVQTWIGRAVAARDAYGTQHGSLAEVPEPGVAVLLHLDPYSHGYRRVEFRSIGRMVPKLSRRGAKLGYKRILETARITLASAKKAERALELVLRIPPDGRRLPIESATDILDILVEPLRTDSLVRLLESPLSGALEADLEARGLEGANRLEGIYPEIARRYVESFRVDAEPSDPPSWDELPHAKVRSLLEAPWPTATIRIVATDPRWIAHFDAKRPNGLRARPLPPAMATPPPPKRLEHAGAPSAQAPDRRAVLVSGDRVWIAERRGTTVATRTGGRLQRKGRTQTKTKTHPSAERAQATFEKDVAAKEATGWFAAPPTAECAALVAKRLGLVFDDSTGALFVTKAGPPGEGIEIHEIVWFKPGDRVSGIGPIGSPDSIAVTTIEELALAIGNVRPGATIYVQCDRPASGAATAVGVRIA
jgi:hypothetical protein